jgi:lipopolysaccharide transport system ATP-binding protein
VAELTPVKRSGKHAYVEALKGVTFDAQAGDRIGIIGKNGSGKSTLLRVLAGIYAPTQGKLAVSGKVSCLFNINLGMQAEATGRQNIILRGILSGLRRHEIEQQVPGIIAFAELEDFIDMPIRTYSSGMSMRLGFSIATAFTPEILLLDEWIGAGDAQFQKKAAERMQSLVDNANITVLATHNRALMQRICQKAIWLHSGEMRAYGDIADVFQAHDAFYKQ